ncbi:MAG: MotA/TolQ/ExbB proton channel family protein [Dongiaceae bacterium]
MAILNPCASRNGQAVIEALRYEPTAEIPSERRDDRPTPDRQPAARNASADATSLAGTAAFLSRCVVLQAVGAAVVAALWIAGLAGRPFESATAPLCWLIAGIGGLGILCVFLQRWRDVQWLATHVVRIGLLGTVVGLIIAFSAAREGGSADVAEVKTMIAAVVDGMYVSLYATLLGIAVNLWLKINLRLLGNVDG